jgi:hypothetical protein
MNDNLATLNARPRPVTIGGESFDIYPLTLSDQGDLQAWLETQIPNPLALAQAHIDRHKLPMEQAKFLLRTALEDARKTAIFLSSPEALPYLNSAAGVVEMLFLAVRKGRPTFTRDQAKELFGKLTPADVLRIQAVTEVDQVMAEGGDAGEAVAG